MEEWISVAFKFVDQVHSVYGEYEFISQHWHSIMNKTYICYQI